MATSDRKTSVAVVLALRWSLGKTPVAAPARGQSQRAQAQARAKPSSNEVAKRELGRCKEACRVKVNGDRRGVESASGSCSRVCAVPQIRRWFPQQPGPCTIDNALAITPTHTWNRVASLYVDTSSGQSSTSDTSSPASCYPRISRAQFDVVSRTRRLPHLHTRRVPLTHRPRLSRRLAN